MDLKFLFNFFCVRETWLCLYWPDLTVPLYICIFEKLNINFEECKTEINDAENKIQKIENLDKDPEKYIFECFEELKRQVDLLREEFKFKLDNSSFYTVKDKSFLWF